MFQEPVEGLSILSADDASPGDATLEISQILPIPQLGSSEPGTILTQNKKELPKRSNSSLFGKKPTTLGTFLADQN